LVVSWLSDFKSFDLIWSIEDIECKAIFIFLSLEPL